MQKRILFCLAIAGLLYSPILRAQNKGLDWTVYSSEQVLNIHNALQFMYSPSSRTRFIINSISNTENRLNFNQEAKNAELNVGLELAYRNFLHTFSSNYITLFDNSDLEPSAYVNKTAAIGYQLTYYPLDSLQIGIFSKGILRNEQDRYVSNNLLSVMAIAWL